MQTIPTFICRIGIDAQKSFVPFSHWRMWYKTFLGIYMIASNVRSRRLACAVFVLMLSSALVACGGGSSADTAADVAVGDQEAAASTESTAGQSANEENPQDIPHEFGLTEKELLQSISDLEAKIAECMGAAGFEYVAVDANTVRRAMHNDKLRPGMAEDEFIAQYGLGVATLYTGDAPQLADVNSMVGIGLGENNIKIFQNLSSADQVAYNHTLLGEYADSPLVVALEREDFSRAGGCTQTAVEQIFDTEQLSVTYVNPKDYAIDNDERILAAQAQYVECVKEAGYDLSDPSDIRPQLQDRLNEITSGAPVGTLSTDAQAKLKELQAYELAITAASFRCEDEILEPVKIQVEEELFGK